MTKKETNHKTIEKDADHTPAEKHTNHKTIKTATKVKWVTASGVHRTGVAVADEDVAERILVAVDAPPGEEHRVIWCEVSSLSPIEG